MNCCTWNAGLDSGLCVLCEVSRGENVDRERMHHIRQRGTQLLPLVSFRIVVRVAQDDQLKKGPICVLGVYEATGSRSGDCDSKRRIRVPLACDYGEPA